jgi:hypothetical protein
MHLVGSLLYPLHLSSQIEKQSVQNRLARGNNLKKDYNTQTIVQLIIIINTIE